MTDWDGKNVGYVILGSDGVVQELCYVLPFNVHSRLAEYNAKVPQGAPHSIYSVVIHENFVIHSGSN